MHGCDERTWLVFNGEIYNFAELRRSLEQRGVRCQSHSDTEVILRLYEAMRSALPILTAARGGPDFIVDDTCGFRIPVTTPDQFAQDIATRLLTDADGAVNGVMGFDCRTADFHVIRAKAVILACGAAGVPASSTRASRLPPVITCSCISRPTHAIDGMVKACTTPGGNHTSIAPFEIFTRENI